MFPDIDFSQQFQIDSDPLLIEEVVNRIKSARGLAYSTFSGRPMSLCQSLERRGELRVKFEEPVYLWPVESVESDPPVVACHRRQPIVSITRDISAHGVGFSYDEPLETDFLIAEFDLFGEGTEWLLVETRWREKVASHAYVAGGLLIGRATEVH